MLLPFRVPFLLKPTVNPKLALRFPLSVGIQPPPVTRRSVLPKSTVRQASAEAVSQHARGSTAARTVYCPTARLLAPFNTIKASPWLLTLATWLKTGVPERLFCWKTRKRTLRSVRVWQAVRGVTCPESTTVAVPTVGPAVLTNRSPACCRSTATGMHACPHAALLPPQVSKVHASPSSGQVVPIAWKTSTHELLVPVQWSAASLSHAPPCEAPVQLVDADAKPFAGHAPDVPVHVSATSHWPAEDRHTVLEDANPSAGHVALVPVQLSATSQSPAAARHPAPALPAGCVHAGAPTVPLHTSVVHTLPSSVQLVPAALTELVGQFVPGESAMSWLMSAVFPVDAFAPVTPAIACDASALSEAASVEPLEVSGGSRSGMPAGAPI